MRYADIIGCNDSNGDPGANLNYEKDLIDLNP